MRLEPGDLLIFVDGPNSTVGVVVQGGDKTVWYRAGFDRYQAVWRDGAWRTPVTGSRLVFLRLSPPVTANDAVAVVEALRKYLRPPC